MAIKTWTGNTLLTRKKETNSTRQYIKGNNLKEIKSNQQKKENKAKFKKEMLSYDVTENRENKYKP